MKDRLRLKDATHVLANIAVPSALALVAQTRDKLLLFWMDEVTAPANADSNRVWEKFLAQRDLAHKILLDICVDSDSEIITQISVLAANGDEAADALELSRLEEAAHGHDVQALSERWNENWAKSSIVTAVVGHGVAAPYQGLDPRADGQCRYEHQTSGAFVVRADRSRTLPDMSHWR